MNLAECRDTLQAVVNTAVNVSVPQNVQNFLITADVLAPHEGLCCIELVDLLVA
jgi:hypothetical protein